MQTGKVLRLFKSLFLCSAAAFPLFLCANSFATDTYSFDVDGYIDGNDYLIFDGSTLQWHHVGTGAAAVGRHGGDNFATIISSSNDGTADMSGVNWIPDWPDPPPNNIRFDAYSSAYDSLSPALPTTGLIGVKVSVVSGRGSLSIDQLPNASNFDTTIIHYADGFNGSAWLDGLITFTVPEPGSFFLLAASAPLLMKRRRMG